MYDTRKGEFELRLSDGLIPNKSNPIWYRISQTLSFDEHLCFNTHITNLKVRAIKRLNTTKIFCHKSWHLTKNTLKNISYQINGVWPVDKRLIVLGCRRLTKSIQQNIYCYVFITSIMSCHQVRNCSLKPDRYILFILYSFFTCINYLIYSFFLNFFLYGWRSLWLEPDFDLWVYL